MNDERWGIRNIRSKKSFRQQLRNFGTPAEAVLWKSLQRGRLLEMKFRRQHSIGRYIVDFYCPERRLVIELDGAHHFGPTIEPYEEERTRHLESLNLKVIRFENRDVLENLEGVLEVIKSALIE